MSINESIVEDNPVSSDSPMRLHIYKSSNPPNIPPKWRDRHRHVWLFFESRQISRQNGGNLSPNRGCIGIPPLIPTNCRDRPPQSESKRESRHGSRHHVAISSPNPKTIVEDAALECSHLCQGYGGQVGKPPMPMTTRIA